MNFLTTVPGGTDRWEAQDGGLWFLNRDAPVRVQGRILEARFAGMEQGWINVHVTPLFELVCTLFALFRARMEP